METKKPVNIAKFLDREGRIVQIPAKHRTRLPVLQYLAAKLAVGRIYTEQEINAALEPWHRFDHPDELRRLMVDEGLVQRTPDGRQYWAAEMKEICYVWRTHDF